MNEAFRYSDVIGVPGEAHRGSARQQIYTTLRATKQDLNLLGNAPLTAVTAPTGTMVSCNMLAENLSHRITEELKRRKFLHMTSPVAGVSDGVLNGHANMGNSLHSRNQMADQIGYAADQYRPDAHIGLFACDKTGPAQLMGYSSLQYDEDSAVGSVPAVMMYAGSTVPGHCKLVNDRAEYFSSKLVEAGIVEHSHDIVTGFKVEAAVNSGVITKEEGEEILMHNVEEIGACQGMYTANTSSIGAEVMGMTAPGSSTQITTDPAIFDMVSKTVDCIEICVREGITPNQIITEASIRNAMAVINALGGSTNLILHYKALAGRLGFELDNEFFREVREKTPLVGDLKPFGKGDMVDYIRNGDHLTLLRAMSDKKMIDPDLPTVSGKSLGDNIEDLPETESTGKTTLYSFSNPIRKQGNLAVLSGNLADHAVMKVTSDTEASFTGNVICYDSEQDASNGIMNGEVEDGMIVVIRFVGPKAAAMPEMLTPTSQIKAKGLKVALISDGRFSGGSYGSVVGHVSPEAAEGGPIAKLQTGDEVTIDSTTGSIKVNNVDLGTRKAVEFIDLRHPQNPLRRYSTLVGSAKKGADYGV